MIPRDAGIVLIDLAVAVIPVVELAPGYTEPLYEF